MRKLFFVMAILHALWIPCLFAQDIGFSVLLDRANSGDVDAMCDVAVAYFHGRQALKDPFKAKCWAQAAYKKGSDRAAKIWNEYELWRYSGSCGPGFDFDKISPADDPKQAFFTEPVLGVQFKYIPKGCYLMGCQPGKDKCANDALPAHRVCLEGFWIAVTEVTQAQWQKVAGGNPSRFRGNLNRPVENVSYDDVERFLHKANEMIEGKLLLPSEAQWEYACRGGRNRTIYPWEGERSTGQANCGTCNPGGTTAETTQTAAFSPNAAGLFDMGGNVAEWCRDYYDKKAYRTHQKTNPVHTEKELQRVVRGGSFSDNRTKLKCSARGKSLPAMKSDTIGFRLVLIRE